MLQQKNIQAWMKGEGIRGQIKEMTQAEQVQLRFRYVQDVLSKSVGNFELTQNSAANKARTFKESLSDLGIVFGREMLPLFTKVIDFGTRLINKFAEMDEGTKETIIMLAGFLAILGPLIFVGGKLIAVLTAVKTALLAIAASNPVVLMLMAIAGAILYVVRNFDTLSLGVEDAINQWVIWFYELKKVIIGVFEDALNWGVDKINWALQKLGKDPIDVSFNWDTSEEEGEIRRLKSLRDSLDWESAAQSDKKRSDEMLNHWGIDLPESKSAVSSPQGEAEAPRIRKPSKKDRRIKRQGAVVKSDVTGLRKTSGAGTDRRLSEMRSTQKTGTSSQMPGQTVNQNIVVNAPNANAREVVKEFERQAGRHLKTLGAASQ